MEFRILGPLYADAGTGSGPAVLGQPLLQSALAVLFFAAFAGRTIYLDISLWLASFSYLGAIVWSRYLERGLL